MKIKYALIILLLLFSVVTAKEGNPSINQINEKDFFSQPTLRPSYLSYQNQGNEKVLVIIFSFSDSDPQIFKRTSQISWYNTFFGNRPSVSDYFSTNSFNKVKLIPAKEISSPENNGIAGWYELSNTLDWYRQNYPDNFEYYRKIAYDAILLSDDDVNYADFDNDGNKFISSDELHIFLIAACYESTYPAQVPEPKIRRAHFFLYDLRANFNYLLELDGVKIGDQENGGGISISGEILSEYKSIQNVPNKVGLLAHEMGHDLGLHDHYIPESGSNNAIGQAGKWCLMGAGDIYVDDLRFPNHICAPQKYKLGWIDPKVIKSDGLQQIKEIETSGECWKLWENGSPVKEYFIIENRKLQPLGNYDESLISSGLLIWHVDSTMLTNNINRTVVLEPADNIIEAEPWKNQNDTFSKSTNAHFLAFHSTPNSMSNSEKITGVAVYNIGNPGSIMDADVIVTHLPVTNKCSSSGYILPSNGLATAIIKSELMDRWSAVVENAINEILFTIVGGTNSGHLIGPNPVNAINGIATITLQSTTTPGLVTIEASSPGLTTGQTTVSVYSNPTLVSGTISTNTTWSLDKSPYQVTGDITVNRGITLTIEPGVMVLFNSETDLTVNGTIRANGTANQHITFTNSSEYPVPMSWGGLRLNDPGISSQSVFAYCDFRYGGQGGWGTFDDVFEMSGYATPQLIACTIKNCRRNGIELLNGDYSRDFSIDIKDLPLMLLGDLSIARGTQMSIKSGVHLKLAGESDIFVNGALAAEGSLSDPIIFTSLRDDEVDGDTGGDGPTTGSMGEWGGIYFNDSIDDIKCTMNFCTIKFAGQGGYGTLDTPIRMDARANPTFNALRFVNCRYHGIDIEGESYNTNITLNQVEAPYILRGDMEVQSGAELTIVPGAILKLTGGTDIRIYGSLLSEGTKEKPIYFTSIRNDSIAGDTGNDGLTIGTTGDWSGLYLSESAKASRIKYCTFSYGGGCGYGNTCRPILIDLQADVQFSELTFQSCTSNGIAIRDRTYSSDVRLRYPGKVPYLQFGDITIAAGTKYTIEPGCIIKLNGGNDIWISGGLVAEGTPIAPIIFTSFANDSLLGDSNNDGHSLANPGDWAGISFSQQANSSICRIHHCHFCYGGGGGYTNVNNVIFVSPLTNPDFENIKLTNNKVNGIRLADGSYSADILFDQTAAPYILAGDYLIEPSGGLKISPGTLFKIYGGTDIVIRSRLTAVGTSAQTIIFTSIRDDRFLGDTNNDGKSNGITGDWNGITFESSSITGESEIAFCEFWYGAGGGYGNINSVLHFLNSSQKIHHVKISHARWHAVYAEGALGPDLGGGPWLSPGYNSFLNFANYSDRYAVYNNGTATIFAKNNRWDSATPELISTDIYDKNDNSTKGEVIFQPFIPINDTEAPQVTVLYPNGGETFLLGQKIDLRWYARDNVVVKKIDIELSRDGGQIFQNLAALDTCREQYEWTASGTLSSQCILKVTAIDSAANTGFDLSDNHFAIVDSSTGINYPPSIPLPLLPITGEEVNSTDLLVWQASVDPNPFDAVFYYLEVDNNADFSSPEAIEERIDSSRVGSKLNSIHASSMQIHTQVMVFRIDHLRHFGKLLDNVIYFWRLKAFDGQGGSSIFSDGKANFFFNKINTAPNPVITGFSPQNGLEVRTQTPEISWHPAIDPDHTDHAGTLRYHLQLDDDGEFTNNYRFQYTTEVSLNTFVVTDLLSENFRWYYRVQAVDDEGLSSPWSQIHNFWVNAKDEMPGQFALTAPTTGALVTGDSIRFKWESAIDPDPNDQVHYQLELCADAAFATNVHTFTKIDGTDYQLATFDLAWDKIYWRVLAIDSDGLKRLALGTETQPWWLTKTTGISDASGAIPKAFKLYPAYPNPFNNAATITIDLPQSGRIRLAVYNELGQLVRTLVDDVYASGHFKIIWTGQADDYSEVGSGLYFIKYFYGNQIQITKVVFLK